MRNSGNRLSWLSCLLGLTLIVVLLAWSSEVLARVGGGSSYSGGSSGGGGGGGGGGGDGDLIFFLVHLIIRYPKIGVPVAIVVGGYWFYNRGQNKSYSSHGPPLVPPPPLSDVPGQANIPERLEAIREFDPNFSEVLFLDFCYSLFARVQEARGSGKLNVLKVYLDSKTVDQLQGLGREISDIRGVIVGSARIVQVSNPEQQILSISVQFESNYTQVHTNRKEQTYYTRELWNFRRVRDVLSPPPGKADVIGCPGCGSPLEQAKNNRCASCGIAFQRGRFAWFVKKIRIIRREAKGPLLTSNVPEVGTDLPTVFQKNYAQVRARFLEENDDVSWPEMEEKFRSIFNRLQSAWTEQKWELARPFCSDQMFQNQMYWIDEYKRQQLRNVLEDISIKVLTPVKIMQDAFFVAVTVRIWASMKDYTVNQKGKVVSGSKTKQRKFSEYWTYIRRRGAAAAKKQGEGCPSCGGPLKITMAGVCEYCGSKVTSGEFDWVLSRIEQDESYRG